ncbi:MAG: copper resistance protein CopC [Actinobacteria bacterium]|nr:copper resistance protein CopC [Actinomycetota bacterium]
MRPRLRLLAAGAALALAGVPLAASAALAHDTLVSAEPASGSTASSFDSVTLEFNNSPIGMEGTNLIQVIGPDGRYYETACPTLSGPLVTSPVEPGAAGEYTVRWRIVSSDGHPITGEYEVGYRPKQAGTAKGSASPKCGAIAPGSETPDTETTEPAASTGVWVGIGVGGLVLVGVVLAVWLIIRRPERTG